MSTDAYPANASFRRREPTLFDPPAEEAPPKPAQPQREPRTLLIDGDAIAWKSAFNARLAKAAAGIAVNSVRKLARELAADRAIVCLSDASRRYFRHELFPGYKPRQKERPAEVDAALEALRGETLYRELPSLEADDVIGILATCPEIRGERVIVADDKDLLTVPGRHFRRGEMRDVGDAEADARHLRQALVGDSGDGYPGCPGIGPKKAEQIFTLDGFRRSPAAAWRAVVSAFERCEGLGEADALLQARLARICRHVDYDLAAGAVRPWTPPADAEGEVRRVA